MSEQDIAATRQATLTLATLVAQLEYAIEQHHELLPRLHAIPLTSLPNPVREATEQYVALFHSELELLERLHEIATAPPGESHVPTKV